MKQLRNLKICAICTGILSICIIFSKDHILNQGEKLKFAIQKNLVIEATVSQIIASIAIVLFVYIVIKYINRYEQLIRKIQEAHDERK